MKEEVLVQLGFNRNDVSEEESGASAFHYYTMDFGTLCLISNANDEVGEDGEWMVEIFDDQSIEFKNEEDLRALVDILKRNGKVS